MIVLRVTGSKWRRTVLCSLAFAALLPGAARATTIEVTTMGDEVTPNDEQCSLREAIAAVNAPGSASPDCGRPDAFGNTIMLGAGKYVLSIKPSGQDLNDTGDLDTASTVGGLTIEGAGAGMTTIDATGLGDRILNIASGATVTVTGLTLTGGQAPAGASDPNADGGTGGAGQNGGAIENAGTLTLTDSTVTNDDAGAGGTGGNAPPSRPGMGGTGGAGGSGGGIYNTGMLTLNGTTLSSDDAGAGGAGGRPPSFSGSLGGAGGAGGQGGGLFNGGTAAIDGSTLTGNAGGAGGIGGAPLGVMTGTGGGNGGAGGAGGGIYSGGPSLQIADSTLDIDIAGSGGAGNSSDDVFGGAGSGGCGGDGGGIAEVGTGAVTITASTLDGDAAGSGGSGGHGGNVVAVLGTGGVGGSGCAGGWGGGVSDVDGALSLKNSTLTADFAGTGGPGGPGGDAMRANSTGGAGGAGGAGGSGGALRITDPISAGLVNVTVAENGIGAGGAGGAGGTATGSGDTNGAAGAGGADGQDGGISSHPTNVCGGSCVPTTLRNTIVADDQGGNCAGPVSDGGHNITFGDTSCPVTNADPKLGQLQDNGGPTETLALGVGSAAIDAIPASGAGCPATDQRGLPRPSGTACDAGAYEVTPPGASTGSASAITTDGATLAATVTANAGDAAVEFEYGATTAYGQQTDVQHVAGLSPSAVTAVLTGLAPGTTYHYRVVATSADGTNGGMDATFTTTATPVTTTTTTTTSTNPSSTTSTTTTSTTTSTAPPTASHRVVTQPSLTQLAETAARWREGRAPARVSSRAVPVGTTFSFMLDQAATVNFVFTHSVVGRRRARKCVAQTHRNRHRPSCPLTLPAGSLHFDGHPGTDRVSFQGRISNDKQLAPGTYTLTVTATGATGLQSAARSLTFTVLKR